MGATVEQKLYLVSVEGIHASLTSLCMLTRYEFLAVNFDHACARAKRKFQEDNPDYEILTVRGQADNLDFMKNIIATKANAL